MQKAHDIRSIRTVLPRVCTGLVLLLCFAKSPVLARDAAADCERATTIAAAEFGIPRDLMLAVSLAESGRGSGGNLRPWPWVVNEAGRGQWFETRAQAEAHVSAALDSGRRNIDIGCFQINHRWHGDRFGSVADMFDPLINARYAAAFLAELHSRTGDWLLAVGAYHSGTPGLAERYRAKVAEIWANVQDDAPAQQPAPVRNQNRFPLLQAGRGGGGGSLVPLQDDGAPILGAATGPLIRG